MTDIRSEIVMWTIDVTGNDGGKYVAVFFVIRFVGDVNQTFRVAVTEIRGMGWSIVYLRQKFSVCGE